MERNRNLRNIVLVGVGLIALIFAFAGPGLLPAPVAPAVKAFAETGLAPMDGEKLNELVASHNGITTLTLVYASWCPYCKKQFTMLRALQTRYPDALRIEYIALDEDVHDLSRFLLETYPEKPFTPYHVSDKNRKSFDDAMRGYGFTPNGAVPYMMLFAPDGKPAKEFKGLTPIPELLDAIQDVMQASS